MSGLTTSFQGESGNSTSQLDRFLDALDASRAPLDPRSPEELTRVARNIAAGLAFWNINGEADVNGVWPAFLPNLEEATWKDAEAEAAGSPSKALYLAFLQLYAKAQGELNAVTGRHLEFYYRRVLGLLPRGPEPDHAHLVLSLKKTTSEVRIPQGTIFATKDGIQYATDFEIFANRSTILHRRILARDAATGRLKYAAEGASIDGLGEPLPEEEPSWHPFGHGQDLPTALVGFAVSSPVLLLREGTRKIILELQLALSDGELAAGQFQGAFEGFFSGETEWIMAQATVEVAPSGGGRWDLSMEFIVGPEAGPVVPYNPTVLVGAFDTLAPVLKVMLRENALDELARMLSEASVEAIQIRVEVGGEEGIGLKDLVLEHDFGRIDPSKVFPPFGPNPRVGSSFYINAEEALNKDVTSVRLHLEWNEPPSNFKEYYEEYTTNAGGALVSSNADFKADLEILRDGRWVSLSPARRLFEDTTSNVRVIDSTQSDPHLIQAGISFNAFIGRFTQTVLTAKVQLPFSQVAVAQPLTTLRVAPVREFRHRLLLPGKIFANRLLPSSKNGFLRLRLKKDFLHDRFARTFSAIAVHNSIPENKDKQKSLPNTPYTPELASFTLDYNAQSGEAKPNETTGFAERDIRFFHITPFGQREEHRFLKEAVGAQGAAVTLLPPMENAGELYLGVERIDARESISMLFQVVEGSANPVAEPETVEWSVLCSNHWRKFEPEEILAESTDDLLVSGVVRLLLPGETSKLNTLLEPGLVWLRATVKTDSSAVSKVLSIEPNAVQATRINGVVDELEEGNFPTEAVSAAVRTGLTEQKVDAALIEGQVEAILERIEAAKENLAGTKTGSKEESLIEQGIRSELDRAGVGWTEMAKGLETALPPKSIATAPAALRGLKAVAQPYASFGGAPPESARSFHTRSSERLRHRWRAVTAWDFEHLVLEKFPRVFRVKTLPHTDRDLHSSPGSVTLVLLPDTRGKEESNPLIPMTDLGTLSQVQDFLYTFQTPFAEVAAINPVFEPVQFRFKVAFQPGLPFESYRPILHEELIRHLSPWAFDDSLLPSFGGVVLRSSIIALVEAFPYVDYVIDLEIIPSTPHADPKSIHEVKPGTAASIITSAAAHLIEPIII